MPGTTELTMLKHLPLLGFASALLLALPAYAQEPEPDPAPENLTISYDVVKPTSTSFGQDVPMEYVLDFGASSLRIDEVKYNGSYTIVSAGNSERDATFSGTYAYLEMAFPEEDNVRTSAPLEVKVNADKTVSLNLDLSKTPNFAAALQDPNIYTLTLVVPEGLFSVDATNINNKRLTYLSIAQRVIYNHTGNIELVMPAITPEDHTTVDRVQLINLSFDLHPQTDKTVQWACLADLKPTVWFKGPEDSKWVINGSATAKIEISDPTKAEIRVRPGMTSKGQYRIDIPMGTFMMYAQDAEGSASQDDPNTNIAIYANPAMSLRYAVGEEVMDGLPKSVILARCQPAEGNINLEQIPSGVEYLQLTFTSIPTIDRSITETVKLYYNDGVKPIKEISPRNETFLRLQTQGLSDSDNLLHVYFDGGQSNLDMPGEYTAVFPAGLFLFGEEKEPSGELTLNFHIDRSLATSFYPVPQTTVNEIEGFTVSFRNCDSVRVNEENTEPIVLATRSESMRVSHSEVSIEGKVARVKFPKQTESGYYFVTIPAGFFIADLDNEQYPNQVIEREWMIKTLPAPSIEPAPGVLKSNEIYEINFDLGEDAEIVDVLRNPETFTRLLRVSDDGEIIYKPELSFFKIDLPENCIGSNFLTMVPRDNKPRTLEPGNYVFIPCQYLYTLKGGLQSGEYFYFWTVLPDLPEFAKPTLTPKEFVKNDNLFTISFAEDVMIKSRSQEYSYLYPLNEDGTVGEAVASYKAMPGAKLNEIDLVNVGDVKHLEGTVYSLQTPRGLCWDANNVAGAYNFDIWVGKTGVTVIGEHGQSYDVYTLDGVRVMKDAKAADLKGLQKGIYIVGGKKIVVE